MNFRLPALVALVLACATPARAWFDPVERFESLSLGPIDDQGGWQSTSTNAVVTADPADPGNLVLAVMADSEYLYRPFLILNDTVRMVFFRFRFDRQLNISLGLSGSAAPDQHGDYDVQLSFENASSDLRVRNGAQFDVIATLATGVWYNAWILVDALNDECRVFVTSAKDEPLASSAALTNLLGESVFSFQDPGLSDLRTLFIKSGSGLSENSGPLYLDDFFLEDRAALNLYNPSIPGPPQFREIAWTLEGIRLTVVDWPDSGSWTLQQTSDPVAAFWEDGPEYTPNATTSVWVTTVGAGSNLAHFRVRD